MGAHILACAFSMNFQLALKTTPFLFQLAVSRAPSLVRRDVVSNADSEHRCQKDLSLAPQGPLSLLERSTRFVSTTAVIPTQFCSPFPYLLLHLCCNIRELFSCRVQTDTTYLKQREEFGMRFVYQPAVLCPYLNQTAHASDRHTLLLVRKFSLQTRHIAPNLKDLPNTFQMEQNWNRLTEEVQQLFKVSQFSSLAFFKRKVREVQVDVPTRLFEKKRIKAIETKQIKYKIQQLNL